MGQLQAAIDKARRQRAEAGIGAGIGLAPPPAATPAQLPYPPRHHRAEAEPPAHGAAHWRALIAAEPDPATLARNRILTGSGGAEAAPWDMLRARILDQARAQGWRRIALASPGRGAGRTTTLASLALSFARARDLKVLALDLDLLRPGLGQRLGIAPIASMATGLAEVMAGQAPFAAAARRIGEHVALGLGTAAVENPADLLMGRAAVDALARIEADFAPDLTLVDMPALSEGPAAHAVLKHVDAALILCETGRTTLPEIDAAERAVAAITNVMGCVLTKAR